MQRGLSAIAEHLVFNLHTMNTSKDSERELFYDDNTYCKVHETRADTLAQT